MPLSLKNLLISVKMNAIFSIHKVKLFFQSPQSQHGYQSLSKSTRIVHASTTHPTSFQISYEVIHVTHQAIRWKRRGFQERHTDYHYSNVYCLAIRMIKLLYQPTSVLLWCFWDLPTLPRKNFVVCLGGKQHRYHQTYRADNINIFNNFLVTNSDKVFWEVSNDQIRNEPIKFSRHEDSCFLLISR